MSGLRAADPIAGYREDTQVESWQISQNRQSKGGLSVLGMACAKAQGPEQAAGFRALSRKCRQAGGKGHLCHARCSDVILTQTWSFRCLLFF